MCFSLQGCYDEVTDKFEEYSWIIIGVLAGIIPGPRPLGRPCLRAPAPALITGVLAPAAHSAGVQAPTGSIVLHLRQQRTRYGSRW